MDKRVTLREYGYSILQIETIASCNMACRFCPYPVRKDKRSILPSETVQRLIDEIDPADRKFEYVCFSHFNEPLMDERIFDFIRYAKGKSIPTLLITNALLLNRENIRCGLLDTSADFIKVSLQTLDRKTFNDVRRVQLDIDKYFERIYCFLSAAKGISSQITIDVGSNFLKTGWYYVRRTLGMSIGDPSIPLNLKSLEDEVVSFLTGLAKFDPSFTIDFGRLSAFFETTSKYYVSEKGFPLADNIRLKIKPFIYGHRIRDFLPLKNAFSCANRILSVMADGNVVPCCLLYDPVLSLGNIIDQSLTEVLYQHKDFLANLRMRNTLKPEVCKKCMGEPTNRGIWSRWLLDRIGAEVIVKKLKSY